MGGEEMPIERQEKTLADLGRIVTGKTPSTKVPEYFGGEIPFITPSDMDDRKTISATDRCLTDEGADMVKSAIIPSGTVIVSCIGSDLGKAAIAGKPSVTNQQINSIIVNSSEFNPEYVYYNLKTRQHELRHQAASGSAVPILNKSHFSSVRIELPSLSEQRAIADLLGAFDDKIELNRNMNRTLEVMVRAIFKAWFVNFDPVKAKAAGSTSFRGMPQAIFDQLPERFSDSELGLVPEGWEIAPLDSIADFLNGVALQKYPASSLDESLPVIKIAELRNGVSEKSGRASREVPAKYIVGDRDFLFSWSGSLLAKFWTEGEGALNQHLFKVTSDRYPMWFVSQWVQHHLEEFQAIAASKATTMGHIQRRHLKEALTVCAPSHVLEDIGAVMSPLIEKMLAAEIESRTLKSIRDSLIPKLISGEVRPGAANVEGA